jgi:hypothetical protein
MMPASITGAAAREHVDDLLRGAASSRTAAQLPWTTRRRTMRFTPAWWTHITIRVTALPLA